MVRLYLTHTPNAGTWQDMYMMLSGYTEGQLGLHGMEGYKLVQAKKYPFLQAVFPTNHPCKNLPFNNFSLDGCRLSYLQALSAAPAANPPQHQT